MCVSVKVTGKDMDRWISAQTIQNHARKQRQRKNEKLLGM